jgi:hypothetical protein
MADNSLEIGYSIEEGLGSPSINLIVSGGAIEFASILPELGSSALSNSSVIATQATELSFPTVEFATHKNILSPIVKNYGVSMRVYSLPVFPGDNSVEIGIGLTYYASVSLTAYYSSGEVAVTKYIKIPREEL